MAGKHIERPFVYSEMKLLEVVSGDIPSALSNILKKNQLEEILKKGRAVCHLTREDSHRRRFRSTGFHYGNGWIMTAAHCVETEEQVRESTVTFSWVDDSGIEQCKRFDPRHRMCFSARRITKKSFVEDLALFKMGIQFEKGRQQEEYLDWEKEEKEFMSTVPNIMVQSPSTVSLSCDLLIVHIFFRFEREVQKTFVITTPSVIDSKASEFDFWSPSPHGASGSPVLARDRRFHDHQPFEYSLRGVMFAGYKSKQDRDLQVATTSCKRYSKGMVQVQSKIDELYRLAVTKHKATKLGLEMTKSFDDRIKYLYKNIREIGKEQNIRYFLPSRVYEVLHTLLVPYILF